VDRYKNQRDREDTPEMVSIAFRRDTLRRWRRNAVGTVISIVLGGGSAGGVAWVARNQEDIKEDQQAAQTKAVAADKKAVAVGTTTEKVYKVSVVKDIEQDGRLDGFVDRFNDLREFCIATRSSGRGRNLVAPAPLKKPAKIPIPPTVQAAAQPDAIARPIVPPPQPEAVDVPADAGPEGE
jgi:hypothetical protein